MLYRELSKVRDELITSKTERRVLSRWYEQAKGERDKLQVAVTELEAGVKASSNLVHAAENERDKLRSELEIARVSAASLERIQATAVRWGASGQEDAGHFIERTATDLEFVRMAKDELQNKLAETTKDLAYSRLAVDTMSAQDKRFTETLAKCGAADGEDIGDFIERTCAERDKLHSELVEVRSALADVSAERDSLRTTLAAWEAADTTPFLKVPDVADHVMPPVLDRGEPDPANDERDAKLEFRDVIPTNRQSALVEWWEVPTEERTVKFMYDGDKPRAWKWSHFKSAAYELLDTFWNTEKCPTPLKPRGMTWKQLDEKIAALNARPMCSTCHGCKSELQEINGSMTCRNGTCKLTNTNGSMYESPYFGHCKAKDLEAVRHA